MEIGVDGIESGDEVDEVSCFFLSVTFTRRDDATAAREGNLKGAPTGMLIFSALASTSLTSSSTPPSCVKRIVSPSRADVTQM